MAPGGPGMWTVRLVALATREHADKELMGLPVMMARCACDRNKCISTCTSPQCGTRRALALVIHGAAAAAECSSRGLTVLSDGIAQMMVMEACRSEIQADLMQ